MDKIEFIDYAKNYQLNLTKEQADQLLNYMHELLIINEQINLTAIRNETEFIDKHLIDSILCDLGTPKKGALILDVGTGGGFPGIPLAIKYPECRFVLLDSTAKKLKVVESAAKKIGVQNIQILSGRAEEYGQKKEYREQFDIVVSRGVASLSILSELCLPLTKPNGQFIAWKGINAQNEIDEAQNAIKTLNGKIIDVQHHKLMKTEENHVIITISKKGHTLNKYPRNFGTIKKRPL